MMERQRRIPYAVMNWAQLVRECYYVDNTAYIRSLENYQTPVFLRPKRFGKSLICSMLEHYYDVRRKEEFQELFGNTDIGRNPTPLANSFLILKLDFSPITVGTLEQTEREFFANIRGAVMGFASWYKKLADWSSVLTADSPAGLVNGLRDIIRANGLPPLYVIIDEYDNFTNELVVSGRDAEYDAICGHDSAGELHRESFFKAFFKSFKAGLADGTVGRTYFTGVLPITLDDLSSGFNVGTVVSLYPSLLGMAGFTRAQVEKYVGEIFADRGYDMALLPVVLEDLKRFYDGYHFLPGAEPLYNSTVCNWYLSQLVAADGQLPVDITDTNLRTDVGWVRRLAGGAAIALEKIRGYIERGEGEDADRRGLAAKFGRNKFFSEDFFPYALYYLGLMTFEDAFTLGIPNLTVKTLFLDYYDELSHITNESEARKHFIGAIADLIENGGTWEKIFAQYWNYYVKARIPAQAFDKMNENFFRLTFTSRCMDVLSMYYSFETEYNSPGGRVDFLAVPRPGLAKHALLIEFKYYTAEAARKRHLAEHPEPDAETVAQAVQYRDAQRGRPDWFQPLDVAVVEVYGNLDFHWFEIP